MELAEYFKAKKTGGKRVLDKFWIAKDMEGDVLLIGIKTMIPWGVLDPDFSDERFYSSEQSVQILHHHRKIISSLQALSDKPDSSKL